MVNKKLIPYLICAYNGSNYIESFNSNVELLFSNFITMLMNTFINNKTKVLTVYAHNFAKFDGILLLKHLLPFGKVKPLLYNGKFISITLKISVSEDHELSKFNGKTIVFKDSLLLLPDSLKNLAISYNCTEYKGIFPFNLNYINYIGTFPQIEYFKNITMDNYLLLAKEFTNKLWSFKEESIKYCKLDCKILFEVLSKFNELVFKEFKVNVHNSLTLPSLAARIFKTHFIPKDTIYQLHGKVEHFIRKSYSGGAVDVYIPHNKISVWLNEYNTLFGYDVNALYPTVMAQKLMPVGKPIAFDGNIRKIDPNAYGLFYCKITSPDFLMHPILQRVILTKNGKRTVAGLGTWEGWIYSEEMDNAIKYGYSFEIIRGYQFESGNIFEAYVNKMFELRSQYPKGDPMNQIAKLLNNSLYGKFGMKDEITVAEVFTINNQIEQNEFDKMIDALGTDILDLIKFDNSYIVVRNDFVDLHYNKDEDFFHGTDVNVAIASAITSEARIHMTFFKNNPNFNLYYSDTDSAFIDKELPAELVGSALGQVKLEYVINKAVFLAPKVYALETDDKTIIKVKGLTHDQISKLSFNDIEALLVKDSSKEFNQEKWFKNLLEGD